ncbi:hypothetical protein GXB85_06010 [Cellulomonas sp. APG4]|uniref:hypothetical protein n=1 Tax=Cellulomonas sp. APG4 TaxID=1538656 RepID=UPI0013796B3B|nr:hypothetical protein [Cellulomonas sp. APG4]NCT90498.1 hypothetical protein [Cellulomonas sp. APG4]
MSDTGRGASDIDEGWVFTLPADDDASWELLDARPGDDMERARVPVEPDDVTALGGTWQAVESGRFTLPADLAGEQLLCWAVPPDSGPATALLRGCAAVGLADGSRVEATWGEAGFRADVD